MLNQTGSGLNQDTRILNEQDSHLFKVGLDYYINDKNTVSFFTNQNISDANASINAALSFQNNSISNQDQFIDNLNSNESQQYNFNYKLDLDEDGQNIELEVDYNTFDNSVFSNNLFSGTNTRPNFEENTELERNRTTVNLDYVKSDFRKSEIRTWLTSTFV